MGEGLSSSPLSPEYCPFRRVSLPTRGDTHILPSASDSNHKLTLIFITLLGNALSDNRDFAFILYAWLGYCCFSPLPWFPPFLGISPDFARNTGRRSTPERHVNNWCISRNFCTLEKNCHIDDITKGDGSDDPTASSNDNNSQTDDNDRRIYLIFTTQWLLT